MLDADVLTLERRRFFLATRGAVWFPISGCVFWALLAVAGVYWSERTWCVVVLSAAVVALPIGVVLFRKLVGRLEPKSPLATLVLPAMLPVALSLGMIAAAFRSDLSLVPLALVIGLASHWPVVGWLFGIRVYSVHAVIRVVMAVAIWFWLPEGRFTWLPLSIAMLYAGTAAWLLRDLAELRSKRAAAARGG
jgi:hypothetical protein